jgi:cbb3-type cytochrome oxidase maturation protein
MDILYLLIPLSVALVFLIMGVFAWALQAGQFDDLDREAERIFSNDGVSVEQDQAALALAQEK